MDIFFLDNILLSSTIGRNKNLITGEVISAIINGTKELVDELKSFNGLEVKDDPASNLYPMPFFSRGSNNVYVGRIRKDFSCENSLNLWVVADNLRKGAATNAVQIAQLIVKNNLV